MFKYPFDTNFLIMAIDTAVNSVKNPYRSLLDSNPRGLFSKGTDKRNRQLQAETAAAEFDADLALQDYNNEYNSPTAKAERMRAAGLNPDLVGIDGVSDSSGLSGVTGSASFSTDKNKLDSTSQIMEGIQSMLGQAMQFAETYENMRSKTLDNDIKAVQLDKSLKFGATDFANLNYSFNDVQQQGLTGSSGVVFVPQIKGLSKRSMRRFRSNVTDIVNSDAFRTSKYKEQTDFQKSRQDYASLISQPDFRFSDVEMAKTMKAYNQFVRNVEKARLKTDFYKSNYSSRYFQSLNPYNDAHFDSMTKQFNAKMTKTKYDNAWFEREVQKAYSDFYKSMSEISGPLAKGMLVAADNVSNLMSLIGQTLRFIK